MSDITAANALILISVPLLLPVPQQLQGFSADDIFDAEDIDATETMMGVDGQLSGGMIFAPLNWNVSLQADSASNTFFDAWYAGQKAAEAAFQAQANVTLTSIGTSYQLVNGFLSRYKPMSDAKKVLQPRKYRITWQSVVPVPVGAAG
jgi:hypothetical protein